MKRWICVLLCTCTPALVLATNPERENRLKERAIVYAFEPVRWIIGPFQMKDLDPAAYECKGMVCLYTVPACEPLYVIRQDKTLTAVMPLSKRLTDNGLPMADYVVGFGNVEFLSGGWASGNWRYQWTLSRDECLAKIGKQQQPAPSPASSSSPTPTASPAPSPSASPIPIP